MTKLLIVIWFLLFSLNLTAQYYIRGEVKDEKNTPLQNVKIYMHSNHMLYYTGNAGGFGITASNLYDSLTFSLEGYETKSVKVKADVYQHIVLKGLVSFASIQKQKLVSITKDLNQKGVIKSFLGDESYSTLVENDFIKTERFPNTGFSLTVNKASYSNIRRFINMKSMVPPDAVRIEEMLNYFNFNYKEPKDNKTFELESQLSSCPWRNDHQLLFLNLNARKLDLDKVPASNFVFLIDISGSMDMPNRLPLLKAAFQLLVKNLRSKDTVSIVVYGGGVQVWLPPTSGSEKQKIIKALEELTAGGSTPGEAAIRTAYNLAKRSFIVGGNNRIILATDGDFNIGQTDEKDLENMISSQRQSGVFLTCLGVGMGNYKDSKIESLAKKGNGNFAYLDDIREAEKVLVTELTQTLYTVANDAYLNVQFNPEMVKEYRLIGYDNKRSVSADSASELEGGEIGSGTGITAIFEIMPTEKNLFSSAPLLKDDIATVTLNYSADAGRGRQKYSYTCPRNYLEFNSIAPCLRFAGAVTMFGLKLRQSKFAYDSNWNDMENIATEAMDPNDYLQKEFTEIIAKARKIYARRKKSIL